MGEMEDAPVVHRDSLQRPLAGLAAVPLLLMLVACRGGSGGGGRSFGGTPVAQSLWSMFHHDRAHSGLSPFSTSADTGTLKWKFPAGGSVKSSPAIGSDGTIYVGRVTATFMQSTERRPGRVHQ